LICIFL